MGNRMVVVSMMWASNAFYSACNNYCPIHTHTNDPGSLLYQHKKFMRLKHKKHVPAHIPSGAGCPAILTLPRRYNSEVGFASRN